MPGGHASLVGCAPLRHLPHPLLRRPELPWLRVAGVAPRGERATAALVARPDSSVRYRKPAVVCTGPVVVRGLSPQPVRRGHRFPVHPARLQRTQPHRGSVVDMSCQRSSAADHVLDGCTAVFVGGVAGHQRVQLSARGEGGRGEDQGLQPAAQIRSGGRAGADRPQLRLCGLLCIVFACASTSFLSLPFYVGGREHGGRAG